MHCFHVGPPAHLRELEGHLDAPKGGRLALTHNHEFQWALEDNRKTHTQIIAHTLINQPICTFKTSST